MLYIAHWGLIRMKWISVKEKLPNNEEKILMYGISQHGSGPYICLGWYENGIFESEELTEMNVSVWCPIPILPE